MMQTAAREPLGRAKMRAAGMRCTYLCCSVWHMEGLPAFPRCVTNPLPTPTPIRTPSSLPYRCLTLGRWNVEGLTSAQKQLELGGVLRQNRQHAVVIKEAHEGAASHMYVPGYEWFGNPSVGSNGGPGFLVLNSLQQEVEICRGATHPEYS